MSRSEIFRFRITPDEQKRLDEEAQERGVTKADLIREALGWIEPVSAPTPSSTVAAVREVAGSGKSTPQVAEPGEKGIDELAKRIFGSQGVPMAEARRRAKKKLQSAADAA